MFRVDFFVPLSFSAALSSFSGGVDCKLEQYSSYEANETSTSLLTAGRQYDRPGRRLRIGSISDTSTSSKPSNERTVCSLLDQSNILLALV